MIVYCDTTTDKHDTLCVHCGWRVNYFAEKPHRAALITAALRVRDDAVARGIEFGADRDRHIYDAKQTGLTYYEVGLVWHLSAEHVRTLANRVVPCHPLTCEDCPLPYEKFPLDVVLPDDQWLLIHPEGSGGVLCAQCIVRRASKIPGVTVVRATLERP